jgi:small subunit ribosomal protein S27Ae
MADEEKKEVIKKKKTSKVWEVYEAKGELKRKNSSCPKCGDGVFMAKHKDRVTCGKCGYTEFISQKKEE